MRDNCVSPLIFVSYSRADLRLVQDLAASLRGQDCQTWIDVENLMPGDTWKAAIEAALRSATVFVLIVSRKSVESVWTSVEVRLAKKIGLRIIPVLIEPLELATLPPEITAHQVLDLQCTPHTAIATVAAMQIAQSLDLVPRGSVALLQDAAHLWIEMHPQGDSDPWHRKFEPQRGADSWRLRLDQPFNLVRFGVLLETAVLAPSATLLVPAFVAPVDAALVMAVLATRLGPNRLTLIAAPNHITVLEVHATLLHVRVLSQDEAIMHNRV